MSTYLWYDFVLGGVWNIKLSWIYIMDSWIIMVTKCNNSYENHKQYLPCLLEAQLLENTEAMYKNIAFSLQIRHISRLKQEANVWSCFSWVIKHLSSI